MSSINYTPLCINVTAFNDRKNVTLNTFAAYILTGTFSTFCCNLINFIYEYDTTLLNSFLCNISNFITICKTIKIFCKQNLTGITYRHCSMLVSSARKHFLQTCNASFKIFRRTTAHHFYATKMWLLVNNNINHAVFKFTISKHLSELFTSFRHFARIFFFFNSRLFLSSFICRLI